MANTDARHQTLTIVPHRVLPDGTPALLARADLDTLAEALHAYHWGRNAVRRGTAVVLDRPQEDQRLKLISLVLAEAERVGGAFLDIQNTTEIGDGHE